MKGLSMMNQYLSSIEGVEKYGGRTTTFEFLEDWSLYGVPVSMNPSNTSEFADRCEAMTLGKLIRIVNPCATIENRDRSGKATLSVGDHIYLLIRRFPKKDKILEIFGAAAFQQQYSQPRTAGNQAPPAEKFYWRIDAYPSRDKVPPSPRLYNTTSGKGAALFVGSVFTVYGTTTICAEAVNQARDAFHPVEDSPMYIKDLNLGIEIDIQWGVK